MISRADATEAAMNAKEAKGLSFAEIAEEVGRHEVWVATALLGQTSMDGEEADAVAKVLDLDPDVVAALKAIPMRGAFDGAVPTDPLLYRLFEIIQVYGPACKAVIHEKFGDGIMSAIDFELDIARLADSRGDRVLMTLNGKFLPYRSW